MGLGYPPMVPMQKTGDQTNKSVNCHLKKPAVIYTVTCNTVYILYIY